MTSVCDVCGVPLLVGKEQVWGDNGVISHATDRGHRMVFCDSDNIDGLFAQVEEMIGFPIENIVIGSKAREVKEYVESTMSPLARKAGRLIGTNMLVNKLSKTGRAYGFGDISLVSRSKDDSGGEAITMSVRNPHSILLFCGESLGAWEAIQGRDHRVILERVSEGEYRVTNVAGSHPIELSGMRRTRRHDLKDGDFALERCGSCGVPKLVGDFVWDTEEGTIVNAQSGRRMAIIGSSGLQAIFDDLTSELGESIPEAVIEAQRRLVRESMGETSWSGRAPTYREMLALRGLGNLRGFEGTSKRLAVTIENSCLSLMVVGMLQAMFELGAGHAASAYDYRLAPDGDLEVEIRAL